MPSNAVVAEPASYVTQTALAIGDVGQTPVAVSATNPLPVQPDGAADALTTAAWSGSGIATTGYGNALIEVSAMGGAGTITLKASLSGGAFASALPVYNLTIGASAPAITAPGLYQVTAAGQLTYTRDAGTPTVTLTLKR